MAEMQGEHTRQHLEQLLHNTHAMRIDIMRWFVPVNKNTVLTKLLHHHLDMDELKTLTECAPTHVVQLVYLEQLYSAMAETFNMLHAQIPPRHKTSDYGITHMLPPLRMSASEEKHHL